MRPVFVAGRTGGPKRASAAGGRDAGMVTAELAMAVPALALVVALLVTVVSAASHLARAADAARSAARAASIGAGHDQVVADASRLAPTGSTIRFTSDGGWVTVSVTPPAVRVGPFSLPLPPVSGEAPLEAALVGVRR